MVGASVVFAVHLLYLHLSVPTSASISHTHTHTPHKYLSGYNRVESTPVFLQIIFELVRLRLCFCSASVLSSTFSPESSRRDASSFPLEPFVTPPPPSVDLITVWKTVGEFRLTVFAKAFRFGFREWKNILAMVLRKSSFLPKCYFGTAKDNMFYSTTFKMTGLAINSHNESSSKPLYSTGKFLGSQCKFLNSR